ncbi:hypothetical protein TSAR_009511 [Trichomalopsis sarcophagae]|uniref:Uncharacterized protein n=1 Tax=Trichomalopsis sarcophagae TaxID=543379 RepID=A0A232EWT0_9HYME|nr:hypothetical protein TSAR_009511 [Trichomalopsis sarcophagae]
MSEHLLGQSDRPSSMILSSLQTKNDSVRDGDKQCDSTSDIPKQRWSSVRVKGGSTKSLLIENGGAQAPLKSAIRKEYYANKIL